MLLLGLLLLLVGCSSVASGATVVRYERDWPDGYHEELTITDDGHVTMKHGDVLERLTLTSAQVQKIRDRSLQGCPRVTRATAWSGRWCSPNGTSVTPVKPVAGSAVELLELLMTTHSLDGAPVPGAPRCRPTGSLPSTLAAPQRPVRRLPRAPMLVIFGWAVVGLLIGHVAAYDLVYPDGHVHAPVLAASGHEWLSLLEPSLVLGVLIAIVAGFIGSRRSHRCREARFRVLAVIQVGAFLGIELLERLGHGLTVADITHELTDHGLWLVLVIGVVAQLSTAWLASAASRSIAEAAQVQAQPRVRVRLRPRVPASVVDRPVPTRAMRAHGSRAPPPSLLVPTIL